MSDLIRVMPAVALRGTTILPDMIVHFDVSREQVRKSSGGRAMLAGSRRYFSSPRGIRTRRNPAGWKICTISVLVAVIKQVIKLPNNILRILVEGQERAELL